MKEDYSFVKIPNHNISLRTNYAFSTLITKHRVKAGKESVIYRIRCYVCGMEKFIIVDINKELVAVETFCYMHFAYNKFGLQKMN